MATVEEAQPAVAYVRFEGHINQQSAQDLMSKLNELAAEGVQRIVLALTTPGGDVPSGFQLYDGLVRLQTRLDSPLHLHFQSGDDFLDHVPPPSPADDPPRDSRLASVDGQGANEPRRGTDDRRRRAPAGPLQGSLAEHERALGRSRDPSLPLYTGSAAYYWDIGRIRESPEGSGKFIGTALLRGELHRAVDGRGADLLLWWDPRASIAPGSPAAAAAPPRAPRTLTGRLARRRGSVSDRTPDV